MEESASQKPSGCVGLVALDLLRRVFGVGRQRRSRYNYRELSGLEEHGRLQDRDSNTGRTLSCENWTSFEDWTEVYDHSDDEDEEVRAFTSSSSSYRIRQRHRFTCFSSSDSSKRWTSADQYNYRRKKGFYCMRLRVVNMTRLMAMMRKVRVAYRRMMNAATASKTMLSLADLYNDIADLIPVPGTSSKVRTIVVIRPIKCVVPAVGAGYESSWMSTTSTTFEYNEARRQAAGHDVKSTWRSAAADVDDKNLSSCRKFGFPSFSRAISMHMTSCAWTSMTDSP